MKYGDICNVMVFKNEEVFNKAVKVLTDNGNGFTGRYTLTTCSTTSTAFVGCAITICALIQCFS